MSDSVSKSGDVLELAEEFLARCRKGERPAVEEYVDKYPHFANEIREVFPAMAMMEKIAIHDASLIGPAARRGPGALSVPALSQLGDFRIIPEIGRGGMGVVYEAEQVSLGRHVALKVLPQQALSSDKTRKRFEREARAAAKLHHTNIVPVFGVGEHDGMPYYAMQYIQGTGLDLVIAELARLRGSRSTRVEENATRSAEGPSASQVPGVAFDITRSLIAGHFESLSEIGPNQNVAADANRPSRAPASQVRLGDSMGSISRADSLSASSIVLGKHDSSATKKGKKSGHWIGVAQIGRQVAEALDYAHSQGILHRDIKPSNLLLDARGIVWVTDFGLAKAADSSADGGDNLTHTGDILGTLRYMPPEAFEGTGDARGDIYSLGLTLYELLAARPAFMESDRNKLIKLVTTGEPARLDRTCPGIPRDLVTIVHKALEREPRLRYQKAQELAEDLRRFIEDRPIKARRISSVERLGRWARRNPMVAASLAGVVVIFLSAFALVSSSYFRAENALAEEARQRRDADEARKQVARERNAERWERYRSNLIAAGSAMQLHNVGAARDALDATPEEHRGWEWRHYYHQLDTSQSSLHVGSQSVQPQFSLDAGLVIFGVPFELLKIWDLTARKELASFRGIQGGRTNISRNGNLIAAAHSDHSIEVWDVVGNRSQAILRGHEKIVSVPEFSSDSTKLATGSADLTVRVWDVVTGKQLHVLRGHESALQGVSFSPDGRRLASAGGEDRAVRIWDLASEKTVAILKGHEERLQLIRFSPRGDRIATQEYYPSNTTKLWDSDGNLLATFRGHTNEVHALEFTADGSRFATGSFDQTVRLWDGRTGAPIATLQGHAGWVNAVALSPDGKRLASASQDQTVRLWDATNGTLLAILHGHTAAVEGVAYSKEGSTVVSISIDGNIRWWDARLAEQNGVLRGHASFVYGVAFHPDGERVASASWDGAVRIWNATTGEPLSLLNYPEKTIVTSVAFHPSGKLVATLGRDDMVRIWDVDTGKAVQRLAVETKHWQDSRVAFSPKGDLLACGSKDYSVHLWDTKSWSEASVLCGHKDFVREVVFSPDSTWIASAGENTDKTVRIWDLAKKKQIQVLEGHGSTVYSLAVSPDGKWLASGSMDGTVRLWDTNTWQEAAVLKHGANVYGMSFTPDGKRLACACANNTIRLWDTATHKVVGELHGHGAYVHQIAWSPDGTRLVSGSGDNTVRVWDSLSAQERSQHAGKGTRK